MSAADREIIVALATPPGSGALAIIRISGKGCRTWFAPLFAGRPGIAGMKSARYYGRLVEPQAETGLAAGAPLRELDEVIVHTYCAPHSFTGEDMVEINCHGGMVVVQRILERLLRHGARLAQPGEFSRRAFLAGRLDLLQAEAIADLIAARSSRGADLSLQQLHGALSQRIRDLAATLRQSCGLLELELDFSEEEIFADRALLQERVDTALATLAAILATWRYGRVLREGARVVLAGRVNVGKSTLMNRLLRDERAIVSPIPGTTRDTLEEGLQLAGYFFKLIDTAGLREQADTVEQEGITRTLAAIDSADILLLLFDGSSPLDDNDRHLLELASTTQERIVVQVINKCDLERAPAIAAEPALAGALEISCRSGAGLEQLQQALIDGLRRWQPGEEGVILTRLRHFTALQRAQEHLRLAQQSLAEQQHGEFIALDLRAALNELGAITGAVSSADLLNDIFADFCIGK